MDQDTPAGRTLNPSSLVLSVVLLLVLVLVGVFALPSVMAFLTANTQYAPGYTESAFDSIEVGDSEERVLEVLGPPLSRDPATPLTTWLYCDADHPGYGEDGGIYGTFTQFSFGLDGRVRSVFGQVETVDSGSLLSTQVSVTIGDSFLGISRAEEETLKGKTQAEVEKLYGKPRYREQHLATEHFIYSRSPSSSHYRRRQIGIDADGKVVEKQAYFYWD